MQGHAEGQSRLGSTRPRGGNDMRLLDAGGVKIPRQFLAGGYIAPGSYAIAAAGGHSEGLASLRGVVCCHCSKSASISLTYCCKG